MGITYGIQIKNNDDPYVELADQTSIALSTGGPPGATAVDIFPLSTHAYPEGKTLLMTYNSSILTALVKFVSVLEVCTPLVSCCPSAA